MNTLKRAILSFLIVLCPPALGADYYTASGDPVSGSSLSSSVLRSEYSAIAAGFAKIAPYTSAGSRLLYINTGATAQTTDAELTYNGTTNLLTVNTSTFGLNTSIAGTLGVTGVATFTAAPIYSALTASLPMFTDASKGLVSNAMTGTGNVVMSASPTLTGTIGAASMTLSGTLGVTGHTTFEGVTSTGATGIGKIVYDGTPTLVTPDITTSITTSSTSFTALAGATTLLTLGGTGASASTFFPSTLDATSSITGAIRTSGGISAAKALNVGTTGTFGGILTANGGITVPTGQAVALSGTTTLSVGGAATIANASAANLFLENTGASGKKWQFNSYSDGHLYLGVNLVADYFDFTSTALTLAANINLVGSGTGAISGFKSGSFGTAGNAGTVALLGTTSGTATFSVDATSTTVTLDSDFTIGSAGGGSLTVGAIKASGYIWGTGAQPGGLGASRYVLDESGGTARYFSNGPDASTNGLFSLISQRSDGTNTLYVLLSDVAGNLSTNGGSLTAGAITATAGITGTLSTAAQPNVTSVGTLTSVASSGLGTFGNASGQNTVFDAVFGSAAVTTGDNSGVIIVNNATGKGWIGFNNANNASIPGQITYDHSTNTLILSANGVTMLSASGTAVTLGSNSLTAGAITSDGGLQTFGANDSGGAGKRLVLVPNI